MINQITISEFGATSGLLARQRTKLITAAMEAGAANHHQQYMWRHFQPEAYRRYGYHDRTKAYVRRKLREKGHNRPLVWSGASEILAKIRDIRSTRNRTTLIQHARGLNRRKPTSEVRMNEEIRKVAEVEIRAFERVAKKAFELGLKQLRDKQLTRVG